MRNLSAEFKEQQNNDNRNYLKYADITLKDGTVLNLDNSNLWSNGFSFEDSVSSDSSFDIGSAIINKFSLTINNIDGDFSDYVFEDATAVVYVGLQLSESIEKIRICSGTVAEAPKQHSSIISLTFYDSMAKFDRDYSEVETEYPASRLKIVQDICTKCGVTLQTTSFYRDDYVVRSRPDDETLTCRQVLAWVAQIGCQWAKCDAYGRLCLGWYASEITTSNAIAINSTSGAPTIDLEDVVITGVQVTEYVKTTSDTETAQKYLSGSEGYVIDISENKLISEGMGNTVASIIGEKCIGMQFRPFSASALTDIAMEAGDSVILTDRSGNTYNSYITNVKLQPGNFESVSCGAKSAERNTAKQYSLITQAVTEARKGVQAERTQRESAIEDLAQRIAESSGAYTTVEKDESGGSIFYLHNKPNLSDSDMVWKMTAEAWGVSTNGGKTWNAGMTVDGDTIVRILTATGINADWITAGKIEVTDSEGQSIFLVDIDSGTVSISGDSIRIGTKTATQAIEEATEEAKKAKTLNMILDNEYQGIPTDSDGKYTTFPETKTVVQVLYGQTDVSSTCTYTVTKSSTITGSWDKSTLTYTVTALSGDEGWVDITASYLSVLTATKRFAISKIKGGVDGTDGVDGRVISVEASTPVLKWDASGKDIDPQYIDFKAYYRDGDSARQAYDGRFKISVPNDTAHDYQSSTDESFVRYHLYTGLIDSDGAFLIDDDGTVIAAGVLGDGDIDEVDVLAYTAGGFSEQFDSQTIPKVVSVKSLSHEEIFNLLTNDGVAKGIYQEGDQLYISFTYAKGGTLTLGGADNGNGLLKILDVNNKQIGSIGSSGINFESGNIKGVSIISDNLSTASKLDGGALYLKNTGMTTYIIENEDGTYEIVEGPYSDWDSSSTENAGKIRTSSRYYPDFCEASVIYEENTAVIEIDSQYGTFIRALDIDIASFAQDTVRLNGATTISGNAYVGSKFSVLQSTGETKSGNLIVSGYFTATGTKARAVETQNYQTQYLHAFETPSPMFGDVGTSRINESGEDIVTISDIFLETVNTSVEYQVFLQKEGQGDLWVDEKTELYFVVKGTPNLKYSWEIKAVQRGYEYVYFSDVEIVSASDNVDECDNELEELEKEELAELDRETAT